MNMQQKIMWLTYGMVLILMEHHYIAVQTIASRWTIASETAEEIIDKMGEPY